MADNVPITAGSGTTIATDDVSGVHYQYVKLTDGTADSADVVATGNGTDEAALRVSVASNSDGQINLACRTTGGLTTYHLCSAGSTNATVIKASAGQVYGWYIYNSNASARKVAFHNTASSPTAGASVYYSLVVPASGAVTAFIPQGLAFATGIAITTVTGLADSDNTAVASNDLIINVWYT